MLASSDAAPAGPRDLGTYGYFVHERGRALVARRTGPIEIRSRDEESVFFACSVDGNRVTIEDARCSEPATYARVLRTDGFALVAEDECDERQLTFNGDWPIAHLPGSVDFELDHAELKSLSFDPNILSSTVDGSSKADVTFDGTRFVVVWTEQQSSPAVRGAVVTSRGEVVEAGDAFDVPTLDRLAGLGSGGPRIVSNGVYTTLVWVDGPTRSVRRLVLPVGE